MMVVLRCFIHEVTDFRLKISTLERCEDVLQKLHDKVEKVGFLQRIRFSQNFVST